MKGPDADNEIKKREVGCAIQGQYILAMFTIMGCFIGCISAGVGGLSSTGFNDDDEDDDGIRKQLAIVILVGCILAVFVTIFSISVVCTYSSYFGVMITRGRRGRIVIMNAGATTTMPSTFNTTTFNATSNTNNDQIRQLEAQNRLLQQQLELQRQLQQQQQQTQYSGGFYPPPPPPTYGVDPAFPPTAPPPSYNDVK